MTPTLQSPKLPTDARQWFGPRVNSYNLHRHFANLSLSKVEATEGWAKRPSNFTSPAYKFSHKIDHLIYFWQGVSRPSGRLVCHVKRTRVKRTSRLHCIIQSRIFCWHSIKLGHKVYIFLPDGYVKFHAKNLHVLLKWTKVNNVYTKDGRTNRQMATNVSPSALSLNNPIIKLFSASG